MSTNTKLETIKSEDVIYLDRIRVNKTSILFIGVAHGIDFVEKSVYKILDDFDPRSILYEEHMYEGFSPDNVEEHSAIRMYDSRSSKTRVRSMDVPSNCENISCLGDIVDEMDAKIPNIRIGSLSDHDDITKFNGMIESEYPDLFSFTFGLRNQRMAREIMKESDNLSVEKVACVVGQCHLFGSTSIRSRISNIARNS